MGGVTLPERSPFGRFSWVTIAEVGNTTVDIVSSIQDDQQDGNRQYYFTFNTREQPSSISWDPDVGVGYPEDEDGVANGEDSVPNGEDGVADGDDDRHADDDEHAASCSSTLSMVSFATLISL